MNTRRNTCKRVGEAASWGNEAPPEAPTAGVEVLVNPTTLTDGELRVALFQMAKAITAQA